MPITIRHATTSDLPTLFEFEQGVIARERPFDPTLKAGHIHYYELEKMLQQDHVMIAVAEVDGLVVGSGYARIETAKPYLEHEQYAYLGFMYVREAYRGRGINAKIIETLEQWSFSRGIKELRLEVYVDNENAIRAYEKQGFGKLMYVMRKSLDSPWTVDH